MHEKWQVCSPNTGSFKLRREVLLHLLIQRKKKINCYHLPIDAPSARLITHITVSESHLDISKPLKTHLLHSFAMIWKRHETTSWSRNSFIVPCLSETLRRPPFASARHWLQFWLTVALHAANSEKPGLAGRSYLGLPCRNWKLRENGQQIQQMWIVQVFNPSWWKIVEWYCINRFNICITSIHWKSISNDNIKWLPYLSESHSLGRSFVFKSLWTH